MTTELLLAFAATAIAFVLLPNPLACETASFALQRGRRSGLATVPACAIGLSIALLFAMIPLGIVAYFLPGALKVLAWGGAAYLMLYVLWSLQDPRVCGMVADNDNLPQDGAGKIFVSFLQRSALSPRYIMVLVALLVQFVDPHLPLLPQLAEMQAAFLVCSAAAMMVHMSFPRRLLRRKRRLGSVSSGLGKPRARFISRRAVSAGYRRIAA